MARHIARSLIATGILETQSPLHVGSADTSDTVDMPLAVNGRHQFYLPGTSLAGALRAWQFQRYRGPDAHRLLTRLWGAEDPDVTDAGASFISVEDAVVECGPAPEILHGLGIDRQWGTALAGLKFDRQVLPRGTRLSLRLRVDIPVREDPDAVRSLVGHLLKALIHGDIRLGAGGGVGLGRITLLDGKLHCGEQAWQTKAGILALLRSSKDQALHDQAPGEPTRLAAWLEAPAPELPAPAPAVRVVMHWQAVGPVMSKAPFGGLLVDSLPLMSAIGDNTRALMLPGSAIKGVLRSQAERIVRTLRGGKDRGFGDERNSHLAQLDVPLVRDLFGYAESNTAEGSRRGALAIDACYGELTPQQSAQADTLFDGVASDHRAGADTDPPVHWDTAFHNAVDRWTGGAADSFLYSAIEPFNVQWQPLTFTLDVQQLDSDDHLPALALVWLLARDLWEQRLYFGFGSQRGYGDLGITQVALSGLGSLGVPELPDAISIDIDKNRPREAWSADQQAMMERLQTAWTQWLDRAPEEASV